MTPSNAPSDPRLGTAAWRKIVAHWRRAQVAECQATRCLLPGVPIRYTGKRGPDSLDVGHKEWRTSDDRTTWTVADTRPEHQRCNRAAGARYGQRRRTTRRRVVTAARAAQAAAPAQAEPTQLAPFVGYSNPLL